MKTVERRQIPTTELRAEPQGEGQPPKITGYAALFNAPSFPMKTARGSQFRERIAPGAFSDATVADVMARYNHQLILGRTSSGTLKLTVDERGLKYEITPASDALTGHVLEAIKRGDVRGSSFAFRTIEDKWSVENGEPIRELRNVSLVDVGPVDSPAYGDTAGGDAAVSVRSLGTDDEAADVSIGKLDGVDQRYYYNSDASTLTNQLRSAVDSARQMADNAQIIIDKMGRQRTGLVDEEVSAAEDLVAELARCSTRCSAAAEALKAAGAGPAPEPEPTSDDARSATPLLAARLNRRARAI